MGIYCVQCRRKSLSRVGHVGNHPAGELSGKVVWGGKVGRGGGGGGGGGLKRGIQWRRPEQAYQPGINKIPRASGKVVRGATTPSTLSSFSLTTKPWPKSRTPTRSARFSLITVRSHDNFVYPDIKIRELSREKKKFLSLSIILR